MKKPSSYKNTGSLQSSLSNTRQLLLINNKYHEAKLKDGYYKKAFLESDGERVDSGRRFGLFSSMMQKISNYPSVNDKIYSHILSIRLCSGLYDFVVLESSPQAIFIHKKENSEYGHTSISNGTPVLLAGELLFTEMMQGILVSWTNKSGHYQVGSHLTEMALKYRRMSLRSPENLAFHIRSRVPIVDGKLFLPMDKFISWDGEI